MTAATPASSNRQRSAFSPVSGLARSARRLKSQRPGLFTASAGGHVPPAAGDCASCAIVDGASCSLPEESATGRTSQPRRLMSRTARSNLIFSANATPLILLVRRFSCDFICSVFPDLEFLNKSLGEGSPRPKFLPWVERVAPMLGTRRTADRCLFARRVHAAILAARCPAAKPILNRPPRRGRPGRAPASAVTDQLAGGRQSPDRNIGFRAAFIANGTESLFWPRRSRRHAVRGLARTA